MDKKQVQQRVLQDGKPISLGKFEWDEGAKVFSSIEEDLVIDFIGISGCTFKTGWGCTFKTGWGCTFKTGWGCTFDTGWNCTFKTGWDCTFDTGWNCTFKTGGDCTFKTGGDCTFDTGWGCTFKTGWGCTFDTGWNCTFDTGENCVVIRRDIYEVIELNNKGGIKLNDYQVSGYTAIDSTPETIEYDGKKYDKEEFEKRLKELKPID